MHETVFQLFDLSIDIPHDSLYVRTVADLSLKKTGKQKEVIQDISIMVFSMRFMPVP